LEEEKKNKPIKDIEKDLTNEDIELVLGRNAQKLYELPDRN
jgi:hypothetical protein